MRSRGTSLGGWRLRAVISVALVAMLSAGLVLARQASTHGRTIETTDAATAKRGARSIGFGALTSPPNPVTATTDPTPNHTSTSTAATRPANAAVGGATPTSTKKAVSSGSSSTSLPVAGAPGADTATNVD